MTPWPGPTGKLPLHVLGVSLRTGIQEVLRFGFVTHWRAANAKTSMCIQSVHPVGDQRGF